MCKKKAEKSKKCAIKCGNCHFYDNELDFCKEKGIEDCTKQISIDFAQCGDFLVKESLVMF